LVAPFSVTVQRERVLSLSVPNNPTVVYVTGTEQDPVPSARSLRQAGDLMTMKDVRSIQTGSPGGEYKAEALLVAPGLNHKRGIFTEPLDGADPLAALQALQKGDRDALMARLSKTDITVAAAVYQELPNPDAFHSRPVQLPRMAVFGGSSWISNSQMRERGWGAMKAKLFAGTLAWLRDRPEPGVDDPKERKAFLMSNLEQESVWAMAALPMVFISLGILGLGASVWVLRRR
jgi:hypothetical protein